MSPPNDSWSLQFHMLLNQRTSDGVGELPALSFTGFWIDLPG